MKDLSVVPQPEKYSKVYLLLDCNNFFVSCERIFRPDLEKRPVLVLSNNDGCVVARSAEVKALGIKMGVPVFKIKDLIAKHHIVCFSSNFNLYLDISNRIMRLLETITPEVLVYSVDEAFAVVREVTAEEAFSTACRMKKTVERSIGVPVSIGIASSKTLAKIASHLAKKQSQYEGVCSLLDPLLRTRILADFPLKEIWGIGRKLNERLQNEGFQTAAQLAAADGPKMKKRYSVVLYRTMQELNGIDAIEELAEGHVQQQIMWSRSFRDRLYTLEEVSQALCSFGAQAGRRLRDLHLYCRIISVYIRTSYFVQDKQYQAGESLRLDHPTSDSRVILCAEEVLLRKIYRPGFAYAKAGVVLSELSTTRGHQGDLFLKENSASELAQSDRVMELLDHYGRHDSAALYLGAQGSQLQKKPFSDKRLLSPAYTTNFAELPEIFCADKTKIRHNKS